MLTLMDGRTVVIVASYIEGAICSSLCSSMIWGVVINYLAEEANWKIEDKMGGSQMSQKWSAGGEAEANTT